MDKAGMDYGQGYHCHTSLTWTDLRRSYSAWLFKKPYTFLKANKNQISSLHGHNVVECSSPDNKVVLFQGRDLLLFRPSANILYKDTSSLLHDWSLYHVLKPVPFSVEVGLYSLSQKRDAMITQTHTVTCRWTVFWWTNHTEVGICKKLHQN